MVEANDNTTLPFFMVAARQYVVLKYNALESIFKEFPGKRKIINKSSSDCDMPA